MVKKIRKRDLIINFLQLIKRISHKKAKKAAPRFELGIKDLQSSALPLGHAAEEVMRSSTLDRISQKYKKVLVLSNGHGEDLIALKILEGLHRLQPELKLLVLPLVGEGRAFRSAISERWLQKIGVSNRLPSGGFSNQSFKALFADISVGLLGNLYKNWRLVRRTADKKRFFLIAVGDLLPLFFAWTASSEYGFVGTPKSDYTWRTAKGSSFSDFYHCIKGTEWDPWEWSLMKVPRCKFVAVRDKLTSRGLRKKGVKALFLGNPMMDGFETFQCPISLKKSRRLILLCGSRMPEAKTNFRRLISVIERIKINSSMAVLVAVGSEPSLFELEDCLMEVGYKKRIVFENELLADSLFVKGMVKIFLGAHKFYKWSSIAEVGLANAGTATEQLVGLGVPCLSLPGKGPQFKYGFAKRQTRLLGGSVITCFNPKQMAVIVGLLLRDKKLRDSISLVGKNRMGFVGGSSNLADLILNFLFI